MKTEVKEFKKKLILEVASKHFEQQGYEKTQIETISKELSIGIGTIYSIFGSKEDLYVAYACTVIQNTCNEVKKQLDNMEDPLVKLMIFVKFKFRFYETNKILLSDYIKENRFYMSDVFGNKSNPIKEIYSYIGEAIEQLFQKSGKNFLTSDRLLWGHILSGIVTSYIYRYNREETDLSSKTPEVIMLFKNIVGLD